MTRRTKTVERGQTAAETHSGRAAPTAAADPSDNGEGEAAAIHPAATNIRTRTRRNSSRPDAVSAGHRASATHTTIARVDGDFDLRALVREVLESSKSADPHVVAREVLRTVRELQMQDAALEVCLPPIVVDMVRMTRNLRSGPKPGSPKWSAVAAWERRLRDRIEVGTDEREWRFLVDCTRDDLLAAANFRRMQASANLAKAAELEFIADAMDSHGVETVGELPSNVLEEVLA